MWGFTVKWTWADEPEDCVFDAETDHMARIDAHVAYEESKASDECEWITYPQRRDV